MRALQAPRKVLSGHRFYPSAARIVAAAARDRFIAVLRWPSFSMV